MKKLRNVKIIILIVLALIDIVLDCFLIKEIISLHEEDSATITYTFPVMSETEYFKAHDVSELSMEEILTKGNDGGLVYFFSPTCSACKETEEHISAFIYYGLTDIVDIYFVDISQNQSIISEKQEASYKITYTPTMLQIMGSKINKFVGSEEIFDLLDSYAKQAK